MPKIIINNPQDEQELVEIGTGGSYFDLSRVLWDDRKDGALPPIAEPNIGGLVRVGNALAVDAAKLAAYQARKAAEAAEKAAKEAEKAARRLRIKTNLEKIKDKDNQDYIRDLVTELGLLL